MKITEIDVMSIGDNIMILTTIALNFIFTTIMQISSPNKMPVVMSLNISATPADVFVKKSVMVINSRRN